MLKQRRSPGRPWLASLALGGLLLGLTSQAQTTPNVQVEVLGTGTAALLGGPLTDPEGDGLDALDAFGDPSWNWVEITGNNEPNFEGGEYAFNIFDHKVDGGGGAKWCCDNGTPDNPIWVAVQFAKVVSLTYFTVTSGNDTPGRDPIDWAIQGSNDGENYTDIYHCNDTVSIWTDRMQVLKFTLPAPSIAYKYIRYIVWQTAGAGAHQLSEIEYFGIVGGATVVDADKDGMPDDWEKQYGFNPNDASDAAKDANGNGISNLEEYNRGFNPLDTTKPVIISAVATATFDTVKITYSKELDPATATNLANYAISPSLTITDAAYKNKVVTLTTARQTPGATAYTVTVKGVKSINNFEIAADSKVIFYSYLMTRAGVLKFSYWGGISGAPVQNLLDDPRYQAGTPDLTAAVYSFTSRQAFPDDSHDNYGAAMEGYLTPTESGDYRFFVYSDDASQLFLSTDDKEDNLAQIAEETGCCNNFTEPGTARTSEPVTLVAGKKYFIRMIYKEGGGGDYGQVAWRKEGNTTAAGSLLPIPGKYLSAAVDLPAPPDGLLLTQAPAPNAKNVSPLPGVTIVHSDGKTAWAATNVTLKLNGVAVTPTFTKDGNVATIAYKPSTPLASLSTNTVALSYPDPGGNPAILEWSFVAAEYQRGKNILFITGNATAPINSDPGLIGLLKTNGYSVTVSAPPATPDALREATAMMDLVFISETIGSTSLNDPVGAATGVFSLKNTDIPIVSFEVFMWDNADWVKRTADGANNFIDWGNTGRAEVPAEVQDARDSLYIQLPNHPIAKAGGMTGKVVIYDPPYSFNWGIPSADAKVVASIQPDGTFPSLIIYEKGDKLVDGSVAPNRRIGLFLGQTANPNANWVPDFTNLTAVGKTLFLNTIAYAIAKPAPPTLAIARVDQKVVVTYGGGTLQSADGIEATAAWTNETSASPVTIQPSAARKFYRVKGN